MDNQAYAIPLVELLRDVPKDSRLIIEGNYSSRHIPVGRHCHEAAKEIDHLRAQLAERDRQIAGAWKALNAVPWAWTADLDPLFRALAEPEEPKAKEPG